jgi:hypothetical protein
VVRKAGEGQVVTPHFTHHLFLSYAWLDDKPLAQKDRGWVTKLQEHLQKQLAVLLGSDPRIWRDRPDAPPNPDVAAMIDQQLREVASMIAVVSPSYVASDWCRWELDQFRRWAEVTNSLTVEQIHRIVKVVKEETPEDREPPALRALEPICFFERRPDKKRPVPLELRGDGDDEISRAYLERLLDLAYLVREILRAARVDTGRSGTESPLGQRVSVYLAETTSERETARLQVKRELTARNYSVLPRFPIPHDSGYVAAVRKEMSEADLAIHIIGFGGIRPENQASTVVELQARAAEDLPGGRKVSRLYYLPPDATPTTDEDRRLLDYLRHKAPDTGAVELIEGCAIEGFKREVEAKLEALRQRREAPATPRAPGEVIYLMCTEDDLAAAQEVAGRLRGQGLKVVLPSFDSDRDERKRRHAEALRTCDGCLLFHRSGDEIWLNERMKDAANVELARSSPRPRRNTPAGVIIYDAGRAAEMEHAYQSYVRIPANRDQVALEVAQALRDQGRVIG